MTSSRRRLVSGLALALALWATPAAAQADVQHAIQPGETLWSIASSNNLSTATLAAANGLSPEAGVIAGHTLTVPAAGSQPQAAGASSPLVSAIGWQESGHNNAMVSPAGAMGIMQVMPGTWDWVEQNLAGRQLDPASRQDNLTAGTLYLNHLIARAGGDEATAIAGYYQGPESVRRIGMLPETQRYVANVQALRSRFGGQ